MASKSTDMASLHPFRQKAPYRLGPAAIAAHVTKRRRDWFQILRDLIAAGVSMSSVARKCGRNKSAVWNWANGGDPKEADARIVLALYARYCPEQFEAHQAEFAVRSAVTPGATDGA